MIKIKSILIQIIILVFFCQLKAQIPQMINIPSGNFAMGSDSLGFAEHEVTITYDFEMGKYETTTSKYCEMLNFALSQNELLILPNESILNLNGDQQELLDLDSGSCQIEFVDNAFNVLDGTEQLPIVEVTWFGAAFYCNMLSRMNGGNELYNLQNWDCATYSESGFRLPTEAEWEYTARYNDGRIYPWGNEPPDSTRVNCFDFGVAGLAEVGSYSPLGDSQLGLCEMNGNVWEWCNDWFGEYSDEPQIDPIGPQTGIRKVIRGAGWFSPTDQLPAANRSRNYQDHSYYDFGFRIVNFSMPSSTEPELENSYHSFIYPNPWIINSNVDIKFSLNSGSINKVEIYTIKGQKIRSIEADANIASWDGKDKSGKKIASGIYLCKIFSNSKKITSKKLLVLR
ncbi:MAG: SUMF1/EgtB/PvdO family nonheme iron enzyme [Candidatus Cloacimonetes bacterium]|nr:SUMF1/EgtB/PvdO family nonheme iron enzyme [Candidatus Cloacimonadota bacterium]